MRLRQVHILCVAVGLACLVYPLLGSEHHKLLIPLSEILSTASPEFGPAPEHWKPSEQHRFLQILRRVIEELEYPTSATRREFWDLLAKARLAEPALSETLNDLLLAGTVGYPRQFYLDALQSIESESVVRSSSRSWYETQLSELGLISTERLQENERFLSEIIAQEAGSRAAGAGTRLALSLEAALKRLDVIEKRIDLLFQRSSAARVSSSSKRP